MRLAAVMLIGAGLTACSSVPDWVDPTSWMGPDTPPQADNGQYPDLAAIPDRPTTASTASDQAAVSDSLAAARSHVQYSADALRGGTEAPAAAPAPQAAATAAAAPESTPAPEPAQMAATEEPPAAVAEEPVPAAPEAAPAPAAAPGPVPGAQAAIPTGMSADFQPSKAPPLDASVAQFVPSPIMQRYAATGPVAPAAIAGRGVKLKAPEGTRTTGVGTGATDVGGPEAMGGAVVADLGAVGGPAVPANIYVGPGSPVAVVMFSGTSLSAAGREQIRGAVAAYRAQGSQGYVRVVGHASGPVSASSVRRIETNFRAAQASASAVARELIQEGVPAEKVLVETSTDADGAGHGRRAEIYLGG